MDLHCAVADAVAADHPYRPDVLYSKAAYRILALAYGHWTMSELGMPPPPATPPRCASSPNRLSLGWSAHPKTTDPEPPHVSFTVGPGPRVGSGLIEK